MGGFDQPACPVILNMALIRQLKLAEELINLALCNGAVSITTSHHLIEMIRLLGQSHLSFNSLKVLLKLLDWIIFSHLLDGCLKL